MNAAEPQKMPVPNKKASIHDAVCDDLQSRKEVGIRKYGTPLQPFNGRSGVMDAYQEVLDLSVYLKQVEIEWEAIGEVVDAGIEMAVHNDFAALTRLREAVKTYKKVSGV